jgi:hypothetical protein
MILRPAGRFATGPLPPGDLAGRFLAAVIRPPLLFLAIDVGFGGVVSERLIAGGMICRREILLYGV